MQIGYADPPYIGCAHLYSDHPDYAGEVDHADLLRRLEDEFDGWVLHASATPTSIATLAPPRGGHPRGAVDVVGQGVCGLQAERFRRLCVGAGHREASEEARRLEAASDA